ncbi:acyl carrier protein [Pseudomonas sp. UFMG81]|jgi:acyl carrier protein|uniref:acyl carrier protein n=1 Tax=Pseudomonas sp. UFMG81 TaxID=2745936 RepID=UPI00188F128E|nr:phosphopantetheine-binding protein [Pseudomonas sp. UFMG81]
MATVAERLTALLAKQLNIDLAKIKPEDTLNSLELSEFDQVEFLMAIEEKFGVQFSESADFHSLTVSEMTDWLGANGK